MTYFSDTRVGKRSGQSAGWVQVAVTFLFYFQNMSLYECTFTQLCKSLSLTTTDSSLRITQLPNHHRHLCISVYLVLLIQHRTRHLPCIYISLQYLNTYVSMQLSTFPKHLNIFASGHTACNQASSMHLYDSIYIISKARICLDIT